MSFMGAAWSSPTKKKKGKWTNSQSRELLCSQMSKYSAAPQAVAQSEA